MPCWSAVPFASFGECCTSGGGDGEAVFGIRGRFCLTSREGLNCLRLDPSSYESGMTLTSGARPFLRSGSFSRDGRGSSGSSSDTLCLLLGFQALDGDVPLGRTLPSLSLLRVMFGSNRRADVGGTESRMLGFAAA